MASNPTLQMTLAHDSRFLNRLQYLICEVAIQVKNETVADEPFVTHTGQPDAASAFAAWHPARAAYAGEVLADPAGKTTTMAITIVGATNLVSDGSGFNDNGDCVSNSSDAAIKSQIATLWNAFAGVV